MERDGIRIWNLLRFYIITLCQWTTTGYTELSVVLNSTIQILILLQFHCENLFIFVCFVVFVLSVDGSVIVWQLCDPEQIE